MISSVANMWGFSEMKILYDIVKTADFADLKCKVLAKTVTVHTV